MRIGVIYHKFVPAGGQERYLFNVVREFLRQGHEVHVLAARRGDDGLAVRFHRVPILDQPHSLRMLSFAFNSRAVARGLDLDITYGLGKTFYQDVHRSGGGLHRVYLEQAGQLHRRWWSPKDWAALYLDGRLYHGGETKWFVANSQLIRDQIVRAYGVEPGKIEVIYTGVDEQRFNPALAARGRAERRAALGLAEGERVFLFASFDHPRKGLDPLLEAFVAARGRLVIVGRPLNRFYRERIARLGLTDRAVDAGPQSAMATWYGLADFLVLPSLYDPLPNVVLESWACGTPVIVSNQTGAAERVEPGRDGFVVAAGDAGALRAVFERINALGDGEMAALREAAAAKGRQFDLAGHVRALISLFERVRKLRG